MAKQTTNQRGHDYELPPPLINALANGTTWALRCECDRRIVVDVIGLLERHESHDAISFDRARCKVCGGRLKLAGGHVLAALQHIGKMPRLITTDGSDFRRARWRRRP